MAVDYDWTDLLWSSYIGSAAQQLHTYAQGVCKTSVYMAGKNSWPFVRKLNNHLLLTFDPTAEQG